MSLQDKLFNFRNEKINAEKEQGRKFLEENKKQDDVVELPDGIQYRIIRNADGPRPAASSTIKAHYKGKLLNGKEFDSSYRRNQPFTAPLKALIQGWQEVIPLMPLGSIYQIWLPSEKAYGDRGAGSNIPGGATLEFEIELLEIV